MWCSWYWCVALGNADSKRTRPQHSGGAVPSNTSSISHFCRVLPVFHLVRVAIVRVCLKTSEDLQTLSSTVIYFHWRIFIEIFSLEKCPGQIKIRCLVWRQDEQCRFYLVLCTTVPHPPLCHFFRKFVRFGSGTVPWRLLLNDRLWVKAICCT